MPARHREEFSGWALLNPAEVKPVRFEDARKQAESGWKNQLADAKGKITTQKKLLSSALLDQSGASASLVPRLQADLEKFLYREGQLQEEIARQRAANERAVKVYRAP